MRAAVEERDGPFGDYSQAPPERRPDPRNVISDRSAGPVVAAWRVARRSASGRDRGGSVRARRGQARSKAGFEPTVFEASGALGEPWQSDAPPGGVWPGMRTNTNRAMTAFSDFPAPAEHALHRSPRRSRASAPTRGRVRGARGGSASARGCPTSDRAGPSTASRSTPSSSPRAVPQAGGPEGAAGVRRRARHAFDYPGAEPLAGRRTFVYGNGISGLEIASDLAPHAPVISACRKPRYVIRKVVDGVSSDWQWYTLFGQNRAAAAGA